jgi:hypothetical protein
MTRIIELKEFSHPAKLMARAASTFLKKGKGNLPDSTVRLNEATIDKDAVKRYLKVCGFEDSTNIPATFLHAYIFPLHSELLCQPEVPFPVPGLIHFANSIKQHRALSFGEKFSVSCSFGNFIAHEKGQGFEVISYIKSGGEVIWEDESIYLYKGKEGIGKVLEWEQPSLTDQSTKESWSLSKNLGVEFAIASGDFNPIHLHPLSAKLFGFERHIIHGMWSVGKILSEYEKRIGERFELTVSFKTPIFLPENVIFRQEKTLSGFDFDLVDSTQEKPHLKGFLRRL